MAISPWQADTRQPSLSVIPKGAASIVPGYIPCSVSSNQNIVGLSNRIYLFGNKLLWCMTLPAQYQSKHSAAKRLHGWPNLLQKNNWRHCSACIQGWLARHAPKGGPNVSHQMRLPSVCCEGHYYIHRQHRADFLSRRTPRTIWFTLREVFLAIVHLWCGVNPFSRFWLTFDEALAQFR